MTTDAKAFETTVTVFMLVKTSPEWLSFPTDKRFELGLSILTPIIKKHSDGVSLRFFDVEFYSTRVTDIWMWDAKDHRSYQLLVEDLRESPFWDRYFEIVEILPGVENAYAINNDREPITA